MKMFYNRYFIETFALKYSHETKIDIKLPFCLLTSSNCQVQCCLVIFRQLVKIRFIFWILQLSNKVLFKELF